MKKVFRVGDPVKSHIFTREIGRVLSIQDYFNSACSRAEMAEVKWENGLVSLLDSTLLQLIENEQNRKTS